MLPWAKERDLKNLPLDLMDEPLAIFTSWDLYLGLWRLCVRYSDRGSKASGLFKLHVFFGLFGAVAGALIPEGWGSHFSTTFKKAVEALAGSFWGVFSAHSITTE